MRVALLTALVLLVAQVAAQAHAYSHLHPGFDTTQQLDAHGRLCSECLAVAPLLATAGSTGRSFLTPPQGVTAAADVVVASLISHEPTLAFRSRAPPRNQ